MAADYPIEVKIGYGNVKTGVTPMDASMRAPTADSNGFYWEQRAPWVADLIIQQKSDIFFATECRENNEQYLLLLDALRLKDPASDWQVDPGINANMCFYKGTKFNFLQHSDHPYIVEADIDTTRYFVHSTLLWKQTTTQLDFINTHMHPFEPTPRIEDAKQVRDYMRGKKIHLFTGDFNAASQNTGQPRWYWEQDGWLGMRARGAVANVQIGTAPDGNFIEDFYTKPNAVVDMRDLRILPARQLNLTDHAGFLFGTMVVLTDYVPPVVVDPGAEPEPIGGSDPDKPTDNIYTPPAETVEKQLDESGADYVYLFCGIKTDQVVFEAPAYGVSFSRQMNGSGDGTASVNLDAADYSNQDAIDGTIPGLTSLYVERNGALLWGGIIWSRTYQSQAKVLSMTLQTFESFLYKIPIEETLTFTNMDQRNIVCQLVMHCQQKQNCDINISIDLNYPFPNNVTRSVTFSAYDGWTYGKALEYMAEYDTGLDYTIEVFYDEGGRPTKRLRVDDVLGATLDNSNLVFDYPGNVNNYFWPENASRGALKVIGTGAGDGADKLTTTFTNETLLAAGYPEFAEFYSNSDVSTKTTLEAQTGAELLRLAIPIVQPTIDVDPQDPSFPFGSWGIGDYAKFVVEDARFPDGMERSVRIVGYQASAPSSNGAESVALTLEGDD